ncbi:hypothetical protein WJX75_007129 [Coccomyxa subellipsoidea]|uniref:Uncharacterized protein n=1 Tax=Coccomyxa subellipsoidea TaxID=248742 RepID=A0ABR2YVX0_9CHLO
MRTLLFGITAIVYFNPFIVGVSLGSLILHELQPWSSINLQPGSGEASSPLYQAALMWALGMLAESLPALYLHGRERLG